ncbi:hypothetical protein L210DRAFT_938767 [Boletus edulis BED1]|uniref:Uncharacterized protein n=1 Tax=Boletus edulis BED1 TaxID=1328754 RepID=A0AAD4C8Z9_BOLED|nr:hypothetical protein L210DRAFT_938767 [Boletus edulis BED1]
MGTDHDLQCSQGVGTTNRSEEARLIEARIFLSHPNAPAHQGVYATIGENCGTIGRD